MDSELIKRNVGQFPVSVGTSLALEGLLGMHPNQPRFPAGHRMFSSLWINLRTLIRNLYQATKAEDVSKVKFINAVTALLSELQVIPQVLSNAKREMACVFYIEDLGEFGWLYPKALRKQAKTDKQLFYKTFEELVLGMLLQHMQEEKIPYTVVKRQPPIQRTHTLLLTHEPHQLLWKEAFDRLMLLESNTGKLKLYNEWFTKLNTITVDTPMPFNRYTLQVFGDNTVFDAQPRNIKDEMKQIAVYKKWTGVTSEQKMAADIRSMGSEALKKNYAELMP